MSGIADKLKKLTGAFSKKGNNGGGAPPFAAEPSPFGEGPPGMGGVPDLTAGGPPDMGGGPPGMSSPTGQASEPANNQMAEENAKKISEIEGRLSKVDVNISMVQRESEEVKKTVEKIDQSVLELLSLYEIVSNQVNPFVGEAENGRENIERFEKVETRMTEFGDMAVMLKNELDVLSQRTEMPEVSPETDVKISDIETKIDAFADAMVILHESIETMSSKTDELSQRTEQFDQNIVDLAETTSNISTRVDDLEKTDFSKMAQKAVVESSENEEEDKKNSVQDNVTEIKTKDGYPIVRLDSIKGDPMSVVVLLNWIEFLMERVGRNNLMDALDYYVDIGWISEDVRFKIMAYARGIDYYVEKPTWRLLPEDHTKSLLFIERLCGRKIDKNMLSTIDREMSKVKHGLEELYGI
ncbi:MAG TPA: flagella protein [Methanosarcinaceae archaeon]|nr:flagella protein [Methanosarcinaceae archaeon]